ncbi:Uncharacterised protein [Vibrio cholerae]|nr:Uncharacterised protein [Vibrio cholerae]
MFRRLSKPIHWHALCGIDHGLLSLSCKQRMNKRGFTVINGVTKNGILIDLRSHILA